MDKIQIDTNKKAGGGNGNIKLRNNTFNLY